MNPNPFLQYRHASGFGDFIACTLHSKYINPITIAITGKDGLCASCDARRQALNVLFPIPFWKLFFKTEDEKNKNIEKYLIYKDDEGNETPFTSIDKNKIESKKENIEEEFQSEEEIGQTQIIKNVPEVEEIQNYKFLNSSDIELDNYILRTIIYKKI